MTDCSYILKVKHNDKYYICNRNSTWFNNLIKASNIINFWGIEYESVFQISEDYQIIEILPYSNTKCKDQKIINERKKVIIAEDPELNEDEKICDIVISSTIQKYKSKMREYKKRILASLDKCTPNEVESFIRFARNNTYMRSFCGKNRYQFPTKDIWKEKANINFKKSEYCDKLYAFWLLWGGIGIGEDEDQGIKTIKGDIREIFRRSSAYKKARNEKTIKSIKKEDFFW